MGGVKAGANLAVAGDGTLSAPAPYTLPAATSGALGGVKVGANLTVAGDGTIAGAAPYTLPIATSSVLGGVKQGANVTIAGDGTISAASGGGGTVMGASGSSHAAGIVPDPGATQGAAKFLREDATWAVPAGGAPAGQTVRNIATRCRHDYQYYTGATIFSGYGASAHVNMGDSVSSIQLVLGNWIANNTGEISPSGGSMTEWAAIEYPSGFYTPVEWGTASGTAHASSIVIAAGADVTSDPIPVAISHGAKFRVWRYRAFTSGTAGTNMPVSASAVSSYDDVAYFGFTVLPTMDPMAIVTGATGSKGGTSAAMSQVCYPLAILGLSSVPSVMLIGDSRCSGRADSTSSALNSGADYARGGVGEVARSVGYARPYVNMGCETDTIQQFNLQHTYRARQQAYHTDVVCQYGINDVTAGRTAPVILAALQTAWGYFPTKNMWATTIQPVTTSTDAWATTANQTVTAGNPVRTSLNNSIRAVPSPLKGMFEIADVVETARDSGIWNVIAGVGTPTGDGTHEAPLLYQYIQRSGAINPSRFV